MNKKTWGFRKMTKEEKMSYIWKIQKKRWINKRLSDAFNYAYGE